jgi:hypothetical protein
MPSMREIIILLHNNLMAVVVGSKGEMVKIKGGGQGI